jgi:hypothetical protein
MSENSQKRTSIDFIEVFNLFRKGKIDKLKKSEFLKQVLDASTGETAAHFLLRLIETKIEEENEKRTSILNGFWSSPFKNDELKEIFFAELEKHRDILKLKDITGWTVAHQMAKMGYRFDPVQDKEILALRDNSGITVAEIQMMNRYIFDPERDREILSLPSSEEGKTLLDLQNEMLIEKLTGEIAKKTMKL